MTISTHSDTLTLGSLSSGATTFGVATHAEDNFKKFAMDGILGVGMPGIAQFTLPVVFDTFTDIQTGAKGVLTFYLQPQYINNRPNPLANASKIVFGDCKTPPNMLWHKFDALHASGSNFCDSNGGGEGSRFPYLYYYWTIGLSGLTVGTKNISILPSAAIVDTGTSAIMVPTATFASVIQAIEQTLKSTCQESSNGDWICSNCLVENLPSIMFTFDGSRASFALEPTYYAEPTYLGSNCYLLLQDGGKTLSNAEKLYGGKQLWILGDTFLKKYPAYFDAYNRQVGLACTTGACGDDEKASATPSCGMSSAGTRCAGGAFSAPQNPDGSCGSVHGPVAWWTYCLYGVGGAMAALLMYLFGTWLCNCKRGRDGSTYNQQLMQTYQQQPEYAILEGGGGDDSRGRTFITTRGTYAQPAVPTFGDR